MHRSLGAFLILSLACAAASLANDTSLHEGRWGPEPVGGNAGPESPIRMVRETLRIDFGRKLTEVTARFAFRNSQATALTQEVGFPDVGAAETEQHRRDREAGLKSSFEGENSTGGLMRMRTLVNGKTRKSRLRYGSVQGTREDYPAPPAAGGKGELMAWHTVAVSFPPGQEVTVERRYRVKNGWQVLDIRFFEYTTATGGVWHGSIGQLTADVFLRDGLTIEDLAWNDSSLPKGQREFAKTMNPSARAEWRVLSSKHLRLVWQDFEPRTDTKRRGFIVATKAEAKAAQRSEE